jgi:uncharacterized membrane protein HdeD (DUF308 family)
MDERLKKRMMWFRFAGLVNLVLGLYVLIAGPALLGWGKALMVAAFFLGFAAVDFWFPRLMHRQWLAEQERLRQLQEAAAKDGEA